MATATTEPYRTYTPRPFTRAQRDSTTVLFGGLHWRLERLLQAVLENSGYKARILPVATKEDLLTGREVADIGQCCPTSFTTGNLVNFLKKEAKSDRRGRGEQELRLPHRRLLRRLPVRPVPPELRARAPQHGARGLPDVPAGAGPDGPEGGHGRRARLQPADHVRLPVGDLLRRSGAGPRVPGPAVRGRGGADETRSCARAWTTSSRSSRTGRKRTPGAPSPGTSARRTSPGRSARFTGSSSTIEVDRLRVKPKVKITGEFYLQTVEGDPNYNIHRWLEAEGAEVYPAAVTVWMDYLLRLGLQRFEDYSGIERGARLKLGAGRAVQALYRWTFDRLRRAMGDLPHEMPEPAGAAAAGGAVLPQPPRRRRGRHAGRKVPVGPQEEEGPHDLRAVALLLHAEHHEHRRDGRGRGQVPGPPLRAARDQGRRRGARPVALPDDPDRGEEAGPARVRRGAGGRRASPPRRCAPTWTPAPRCAWRPTPSRTGAWRRAPPPTSCSTSRS